MLNPNLEAAGGGLFGPPHTLTVPRDACSDLDRASQAPPLSAMASAGRDDAGQMLEGK